MRFQEKVVMAQAISEFETKTLTSFSEVAGGQADDTISCQTVHKANGVSKEAVDTKSNIQMEAGTLLRKDSNHDSEIQRDLENPKIGQQLLTDVKAQALNDPAYQKKLSEPVNTRPESVLKDMEIKVSTEDSQSLSETHKSLGLSHCSRKDEELTKLEDYVQTFKSATASDSNSTYFDKATGQKHCTKQDEDETIKIKNSIEDSQRPANSDKAIEQKKQENSAAINQEDSAEKPENSEKAIEQKKQENSAAINQEDSAEISQISPFHDKALEQQNSPKQYAVETTRELSFVKPPQRPPDADKAQEKQDKVEACKLEVSTEASQSSRDADNATEQKHCTQQDEVKASNLEFASVSQNPTLAEQETEKLHIDARAFGEAKMDSVSTIQTAEKTAYFVLQKVLSLLQSKVEEKLSAANAFPIQTSAEEPLSADKISENNIKFVKESKVKEDLDDLLKDLTILQSSISQKMERNYKLDEWRDIDDSTVLSTKMKLTLGEAIADLEKAKILEAHAVQNAGQKVDELEEAKNKLRKASHENASLSATIDSLRIRWNITKAELETLLDREKTASAVVAAIKDDIKNVKADTTGAIAAEVLSGKIISALTASLQEMSIEADKAKIPRELAMEEAHKAKIATRQVKAAVVTAECKLQAAYREAEAAKASEAMALEEIKYLSQTRSKIFPDAEIIETEHYEDLSKKLEETDKQARGKLAEVMSLLEAEKGAEQELLRQLQEAMADIEASKSAKQEALQQAEAAEAAKVAVEGELRRWRAENRERRYADAAAGISTPSPTYSGRLLTPQTPDMKIAKTDHFAQVYQLSFPPPPEKDYPVKNKLAIVKKTNFFTRILSFFFLKKRHVRA